jgi:hypothetical protein
MSDSKQIRSDYELSVKRLSDLAAGMRTSGTDLETMARTLHAERRALAARFKELTPEPLRSELYGRTLDIYGDRSGPTIDYLRKKGKSWDDIIESACRPGVSP